MIKFDILDIQKFFFHHSDKFLNIFVIFFCPHGTYSARLFARIILSNFDKL